MEKFNLTKNFKKPSGKFLFSAPPGGYPKGKDGPMGVIELYSPKYFGACMIGGILSCGITHTAVTPLDLVKCNVQANPNEFKNTFQGFRYIYSGQANHLGYNAGLRGVVKGFGPTFFGYSIQGLFKFGLYEVFKHYIGEAFGEENKVTYRDLIYLLSSSGAEFVADIGLCPFEAVKVRVQTNPTFARGLMDGLPKMVSQEGFGTLFAGIYPLWARQIPYTIIKFMAFERIAEFVYSLCPKPKSQMNQVEQMGVVFTSGYLAGILCGAVSHPADTLVSKINKLQTKGSFMQKSKIIYGDIGFGGLWAGFLPRVVMIGTLTGLQWFIYGAFKTWVGLPAPGQSKEELAEELEDAKKEH